MNCELIFALLVLLIDIPLVYLSLTCIYCSDMYEGVFLIFNSLFCISCVLSNKVLSSMIPFICNINILLIKFRKVFFFNVYFTSVLH
jgi:hypothetical protein